MTALSRLIRWLRCTLFHRRHHHSRIAGTGAMDCEVQCQKCGRTWMVN